MDTQRGHTTEELTETGSRLVNLLLFPAPDLLEKSPYETLRQISLASPSADPSSTKLYYEKMVIATWLRRLIQCTNDLFLCLNTSDESNINSLIEKTFEWWEIYNERNFIPGHFFGLFMMDFTHDFGGGIITLRDICELEVAKRISEPFHERIEKNKDFLLKEVLWGKFILKAFLFLIGEDQESAQFDINDLMMIAQRNAERFDYTVRIINDESEISEREDKTIFLLVDKDALDSVVINFNAVMLQVYNFIKNSLKLTTEQGKNPPILVRIQHDKSLNAAIIGVKDFGIGFNATEIKEILRREAQHRRDHHVSLTLADKMLLNDEVRHLMPEAFLIYLLFERGRKTDDKGTGLGLTLANIIARASGGYMEAVNNEGELGAEVRTVIPLGSDRLEKDPQTGLSTSESIRGSKIRRFNELAKEILQINDRVRSILESEKLAA